MDHEDPVLHAVYLAVRLYRSVSPSHMSYPLVFNPQIQRDSAAILQPYFTSTGLVIKALEHASKMEHIMDFTRLRSLSSLFSMLHQACRNVALYNTTTRTSPCLSSSWRNTCRCGPPLYCALTAPIVAKLLYSAIPEE